MGISVTEPKRSHLEHTITALENGLLECGYTSFKKGAPVEALKRALK